MEVFHRDIPQETPQEGKKLMWKRSTTSWDYSIRPFKEVLHEDIP